MLPNLRLANSISMNISDCFVLGKITKPHGFKGEVILFIDADEPELYTELEAVWINVKDRLVPHFIESIRAHNTPEKFIVQFDGIDTEVKAKAISACTAYAPLKLLPALDTTEFYLHEVSGWMAIERANDEPIGIIQRVLDYAMYPILEVNVDGRLVLIPLPSEVTIEVDRAGQILRVDLPDGLLDAYLGPDIPEDMDDDAGPDVE